MAQWLRSLAALTEDMGSVPTPSTAANYSPQEGDLMPSLPSEDNAPTCVVRIHTGKTLIHKI